MTVPKQKPHITLVAALDQNSGIGYQGQLLCHLPEDLAHFKQLTRGHSVLMGRATWESLPPAFRPLPERHNVVLTRQQGWQAPGAWVVHSLEAAWQALKDQEQVFVIGGAQVYKQTLPLADALVLTHIAARFQADAFFASFEETDFIKTAGPTQHSRTGVDFSIVLYERRAKN
jgi:dihydrofolate reductase